MNVTLGKDEKKITEASFTANLILFWLKADYTLTNKRVTGHTPNTFLGVIPLGKKQIAQPLKTIASVTNSTKFHFWRLLFGAILLISGLVSLILGATAETSPLLGIVMLFFGAVNLFNCYTATFIISNNAGQSVGYEISILEKAKVLEFVNEVNVVITDL